MNGANTLTYGGLALTLAIVALNLRGWWKGGKKPAELGPYIGSLAVGVSWMACTGGILGWSGGMIAGGVNAAGGGAITRGTGTADGVIATGTVETLTPGGAIVVLIATAVWGAVFRSVSATVKRRMVGGLLTGVCLTLTAGAVVIANSVVLPMANLPGDAVMGWFGGEA